MWFDLSAMRPDEYARQRADRWQITLALRNAASEGTRAAHAEKASWDRLNGMPVGEAG